MSETKKKQLIILAVGLGIALLIGGSVAAYSALQTEGPPQATGKGKEMFDKANDESLKGSERFNFREYEKLNDADKREFDLLRHKREMETIDKFFAMSKEEQEAHLDEQIAKEADRPRRGPRTRSTNPDGGDGGRRTGGDGTNPGGDGSAKGGDSKGGPRGGPGGTNAEARAQRFEKGMKTRLDMTTLEERAKKFEYRRQMDERKKAMKAQQNGTTPPKP